MIGFRRDPLVVGAVAALSCLMLALASVQISLRMRFGDLPQLARQIEEGKAVTRAAIATYVPKALQVVDAGICQSEFVKSSLTILLTDLDDQNQDADYDNWASAMEHAEKVTRHALGCLPTNGNVWLRFAMIRQAVSEQPEELAKLVTYSQLYAPAEDNTLAARFRLYNRLTDASLERLEIPLRYDLQVICSDQGAALRRSLPAPEPRLAAILPRLEPDCSPIGTQRLGKSSR